MPLVSADLPAIAGGRPMFDRHLPLVFPEAVPDPEFLRDVRRILGSGRLTNGGFVRKFEDLASAYLDVRHCIAVSSCTIGLVLTLRALGLRGDVIVPSFTFHATAQSIVWNGLKPVFVDCELETFNVDPGAVRARLSPNTAAILAVHLFGNPASVNELAEIAANSKIALIYDAAHAFGSKISGVHVGSFGTAEVFSFSATKLLVAGEGGLIATRDADLARRLRAARNYGDAGSYDPELFGLNARMSEFHAALALRGFAGLEARIARRNEIRCRYEQRLASVPGLSFQQARSPSRSACKDFSVLVDKTAFGRSRNWLFDALHKENIEVRRYFSPPVHRQKLFQTVWERQPLPATDWIADRIINLPIYSSLTNEDVDTVCDAISRAHEFAKGSEFAKAHGA